ncbi:MAG: ATP-binding protein [Candidatus Cloacimonadota bacterium]|nr:ATP-binding protein [Candidatus Cloacimonadota bacterium]
MKNKPYKILFDIGSIISSNSFKNEKLPDKLQNKKLNKLLVCFRELNEFKKYNLNNIDIILVASHWDSFINYRRRRMDAITTLKIIYDSPSKCIDHFDIIIKLLQKGVLYTPTKHKFLSNRDSDYNNSNMSYSKQSLLNCKIGLNSNFIQILLGEKEEISVLNSNAYNSNADYLDDWFSYLNILENFSKRNFQSNKRVTIYNDSSAMDYVELIEWKKRINERLTTTATILPMRELVDEYKLDTNEETIVMYLIKSDVENRRCSSKSVIKLISSDTHEMYNNKKYISVDSKLTRNGLIELNESLSFLNKGNDIRISPDITRRVITKTPVTDDERILQIIKDNNIFTLVEPTQTFDELILPNSMKKTIAFSLNQYSKNVHSTLKKWKLYDEGMDSVENPNRDLEPGMLSLFYGLPGTGKTFAAAAIAQRMGKKLLVTDISRIQSKWVGDSEKNVRRMFTIFERIVRRVKNPPVLLLNEADQFLTKRLSNTNSSVDKMYNALQNIFLEAFENFHGVLIATTNLRDNLDEAFSRRFHLKLEFPFPEVDERVQLWKLHLPNSIPGTQSICIKSIAERYELSGGQIKVIVRNACVEAASRAGTSKVLLQNDLIKYCEIESVSSFEKRKTIGF